MNGVFEMILDEYIKMKIPKNMVSYYIKKGYDIQTKKNKYGKTIYDTDHEIDVKVDDISKSSTKKINVSCDRCGEKYIRRICDYNNVVDENGIYTCANCSPIKIKETFLERYGVDSYFKTEECKVKVRNTNLERYGYEHAFQNEEIKQKQKDTLMKRYGVTNPKQFDNFKKKADATTMSHYGVKNPMQSDIVKNRAIKTNIEKYGVSNAMKSIEIHNKAKNTLIERYGVDNPTKSNEIHQKMVNTLIDNYGVDNPLKSPEIKEKFKASLVEKYGVDCVSKIPGVLEKSKKTLYKNGTCKTSTQQEYICNLYNGTLNYPLKKYNFDILVDGNIDVEYDGGGHNLDVKLGNISESDFKQKEIIRNNIIKREGYFIIRLISKTDKLPSDDVLLHILDFSKNYFNTTNHTWIEWNFDDNLLYNAENKQGTFYDFGELKYIKQPSNIA